MTRVVVESAHGGGDPGAVVNGVAEADINKAVAQRLCAKSDDAVQYDCKRRTKYGGLAALLKALRDNPPDVVVSLHCDSSASDPHVHRASVYCWAEDPKLARRQGSERLASTLVVELASGGMAETTALRHAPYLRAGSGFLPGILRCGKQAAVLVEMGYLSDAHARAAMVTVEWQEKAAAALDAGIRAFVEKR